MYPTWATARRCEWRYVFRGFAWEYERGRTPLLATKPDQLTPTCPVSVSKQSAHKPEAQSDEAYLDPNK